jgi:hypothetical protein
MISGKVNGRSVEMHFPGLRVDLDVVVTYRSALIRDEGTEKVVDSMIEREYARLLKNFAEYVQNQLMDKGYPEVKKHFNDLKEKGVAVPEVLALAQFTRSVLPLHSDSELLYREEGHDKDYVEMAREVWGYSNVYGFIGLEEVRSNK